MGLVLAGLIGGIVYGAILALITSGMTLIYKISGIVNFTHGSLLALAMYLTFDWSRRLGIDPLWLTVVTTPIMAVVGLIIYYGGVRHIRKRHHLLSIQLLLGLIFVVDSLLLMVFGGDIQSAPNVLSSHYVHIAGAGVSLVRLAAAALSVVGLVAIAILVAKTDWGRRLRAASSDELAATLCGVNRERFEAWSWAVGVGSLGLIGPALAAVFPLSPDMGLSFTILALVVLICGGGTSLAGTAAAGVLIGIVNNLGLLYLPKSYGGLLPYLLLVLVLIVRPQGLASMMPRIRGRKNASVG